MPDQISFEVKFVLRVIKPDGETALDYEQFDTEAQMIRRAKMLRAEMDRRGQTLDKGWKIETWS